MPEDLCFVYYKLGKAAQPRQKLSDYCKPVLFLFLKMRVLHYSWSNGTWLLDIMA